MMGRMATLNCIVRTLCRAHLCIQISSHQNKLLLVILYKTKISQMLMRTTHTHRTHSMKLKPNSSETIRAKNNI